jgi:hypothetical protein
MSTSETDDFDLGPCPCGAGRLVQSITTQDNPWSSADVSYSIDCPSCSRGSRIDGRKLVNVESEAPYNAAAREERTKYAELMQLCRPIVDSYFQAFAAKTKKAEHAEMVKLEIYSGSYRNFLKDKTERKACSEIAYPLRNPGWLSDLAKRAGVEGELDLRLKEFEDSKKRTSEAYKAIVRKPMPTLAFSVSA